MMKKRFWIKLACVCVAGLAPILAKAQQAATVKEYEKAYKTYPFSQPDPVANAGLIYPYYRFDGFTNTGVQQKWKVIELENDFIRVQILPQLGGKIWSAFDKKNNKPFIYENDVIKFRDIALRGPWTSGGIEANFGIIGHTPGTSNAVDYLTKKNEDGSVSCIISLLDLLTQTRWSLEVRLQRDKAYFTTHAFWHNQTGLDQPYYSWMNLAVKASDELKFIEPGTRHLFHDGKSYVWPYDSVHQRNMLYYKQNDFGGSQSYHITGVYSKYWGGFWQNDNYGMIHYADREDKVGKKIFLWGLSRSGAIWDKLLNDNAGQYTELQSGRLYIQNVQESLYSPYKQFSFAPYQTDSWTEYWYPYKNTSGVALADTSGVLNIVQKQAAATVYFSAITTLNDTLKITDQNGHLIAAKPVQLKPLQNLQQEVSLGSDQHIAQVTLGNCWWLAQDTAARVLSRPTQPLASIDYKTAYGLYLQGRYQADTRYYAEAERSISKSLRLDSVFIPALVQMSALQYRKMDYQQAFNYACKAISLDTYDGAANYYYGLAALKLNKIYDAEDGFEVATLTGNYRAAAYTQLSRIKATQRHFDESYAYAAKALSNNAGNITALQLQYISARMMHNPELMQSAKNLILQSDPLNHFIRFEEYWQERSEASKTAFTSLIRDELPQQTYLELAIWYHDLNLDSEARTVLETAPQKDNEMLYWLAWLSRSNASNLYLQTAQQGSAYLVFPFRAQSAAVMQWAAEQSKDWKPNYYLSLIYEGAHDHKRAAQAIQQVNGQVKFAPFYIVRSRLRDSLDTQARLSDLKLAIKADPQDWRYAKYLTEFYIVQKQNRQALDVVRASYKSHPENYIIGMLYARCLMLNDEYALAEKTLDQLQVLPYEGAKDGHKLYEQVKLVLALQNIKKGDLDVAHQKAAEARLWPEHLGAGAPYPDMVDTSLENAIDSLIEQAAHNKADDNTVNTYLAKAKAINGM